MTTIEQLHNVRIENIDKLIKTMGGKLRWYKILEIQDKSTFFDEKNIPQEIIDIFKNNEEIEAYIEVVKSKVKCIDFMTAGDIVLSR